jgi:hypothetical protein
LAPFVIEAEINQNSVKPRIESRPAVEVLEIDEGFQKSLLGQILGLLAVAREIKSDVVGFFFMALHQLFERAPIAAARP